MANLKDLLSQQTITDLTTTKALTNPISIHNTFAPNVKRSQCDTICAFAFYHKIHLDKVFWAQMNQLATTGDNIILSVQGKRISILHMSRNYLFARHIGNLLKQGVSLLFVQKQCLITWDNWKHVYTLLSPAVQNANFGDTKMCYSTYRNIVEARKREKDFASAARMERSKRSKAHLSFEDVQYHRRNVNMTSYAAHIEARAQELFARL